MASPFFIPLFLALPSAKDRTEMALFVLRYVSCMLIFVLGLKAPGIISHVPEDVHNLLNNDNNAQAVSHLNNKLLSISTLPAN